MLVTISGLPGSGTTTLARVVARDLAIELVLGGQVFREMAAEAGMSLAAFGTHVLGHAEIDVELDSRLEARAAQGSCVIESRLAGWIATRSGFEATTVWVDGDHRVRAERVARRDGVSLEQALIDNAERSAVERARYQAVYGIDLDDRAPYELVLDSTIEPPEALARAVVARARDRLG